MTDTHFLALLTHDFAITRRDRVSNGEGGWIVTWVEVGTIRGRLRPASGTERQAAAQEQRQITHVLYTEASADVGRGDRAAGAGIVVDVLGVREPSYADHHMEVDCIDVQAEVIAEPGT